MATKVAVPVDTGTDQGQAGVAGVKFFVALLEDKSLHVITCRVRFWDRCIQQYFYRKINNLSVKLLQFHY